MEKDEMMRTSTLTQPHMKGIQVDIQNEPDV